MKIGIVSDTHRNTEYLTKVVDWMIQRQKISSLYHLGDDYQDVACLSDTYIDIVQVPGIYHPQYLDNTLPHKIMETVLGLQILLLHSIEKDLDPAERTTADIILHGHTHKAEMQFEGGHLLFNPGHLKGEKDKNHPASFGMLDIQDRSVIAAIFDMKFATVQRIELTRAEGGLYKVG
jgi:putative phosphoesterase